MKGGSRVVVKGASARGAPAVAGYIRVSSASQDHAYQRHAIELAARARGVSIERWFADVATGGTMERPQLSRLRAELARRSITSVWVWRLDRVSRSGIADTLAFVNGCREAGAALVSVADGFALEGPACELVCAVLAFAAQLEREKLRENQLAARARLEASGRNWGRPQLPAHKRDGVALLASQGFSRIDIAAQLDISESSVRRVLRDLGLQAAAQNKPRRGG